jgi:SAM-dependent methyltransferase
MAASAPTQDDAKIQRVDPELLRCPADFKNELTEIEKALSCNNCQRTYPIVNNRAVFFNYPADAYIRGIKPKSVWSNFRKANFEYFIDNLKQVSRKQILLDVGSGPSDFRELTSQFRYIGMDLVPYELVNVVTDFNRPLPFKSNFCDIVFMSNILEHIPDPTLLLKECYRILRPGGLLLGSTALLQEVHQIPYDFLRYTNFMLEKLLTDVGFKNSKATSLSTPLHTYQSMQRQFFEIVSATRFYENRYKNFLVRKATAAFERWSSKALRFMNPVFCSMKPSDILTEGYGYRGEK